LRCGRCAGCGLARRAARGSRSLCDIVRGGAEHRCARADQHAVDEIATGDAGIQAQSSTLGPAWEMTHESGEDAIRLDIWSSKGHAYAYDLGMCVAIRVWV